MPLIINSHLPDYRPTSVRLVSPQSLPSLHSTNNLSNMLVLSVPPPTTHGHSSIQFNKSPVILKGMTGTSTPSSTRPSMTDKGIQCIDNKACQGQPDEREPSHENSTNDDEQKSTSTCAPDVSMCTASVLFVAELLSKKRNASSQNEPSASNDSWTVAADSLLRNVLSQYGFRFLDVNCQQSLSSKFDAIQANLVVSCSPEDEGDEATRVRCLTQSGMIASEDEFHTLVHDVKGNLLRSGLSKISTDNLEKLFHYFDLEYPKIYDGDSLLRTNDRVSRLSSTATIDKVLYSRNEHDDSS